MFARRKQKIDGSKSGGEEKMHEKLGCWGSELKEDPTSNSCMIFRIVLGFGCDLKRKSLARNPKLNAPKFCPIILLFLSKAHLSLLYQAPYSTSKSPVLG